MLHLPNRIAQISFILISLNCYAHPKASMHYNDMLCAFNGYGGETFKEFCEKTISSGIDSELPAIFREQIGAVPGNHRILGHGWTLNDAIPEKTLSYLSRQYPGKEKEIIEIWRSFSKDISAKSIQVTGLPKQQANAFASILYDIHLLGDIGPGNVRVDLVLSPREISRNIIKDARVLFKGNLQYTTLIEKRFNLVLYNQKGKSQELVAQALMDEVYRLRMGDMLNKTWGKNISAGTGRIEYASNYVINSNERIAKRFLDRISNKPMQHRSLPLVSKQDFNRNAKNGRQLCAGVIMPDGRLLIAMKEGAKTGLLFFTIDAGIATYQYINGEILKPEFHEKLVDAAIKGISVGSTTAVVVLLGATPGGLVIWAVGTGAYVVTDLMIKYWRENQARKYITINDLRAYGITLDTILEMPMDSILQIDTDTPLDLRLDTPLDLPVDSILTL